MKDRNGKTGMRGPTREDRLGGTQIEEPEWVTRTKVEEPVSVDWNWMKRHHRTGSRGHPRSGGIGEPAHMDRVGGQVWVSGKRLTGMGGREREGPNCRAGMVGPDLPSREYHWSCRSQSVDIV